MSLQVSITQAKHFTPKLYEAVKKLISQLDDYFEPLSESDFSNLLSTKTTHLFVALSSEGEIVGMVTLVTYRIPYKNKAWIEDLVVDSNYRGQGIATLLLQAVIEKAKELKLSGLDFTSRPTRVEANSLYAKLGFEKRETNVYRLKL